MAGELNPQSATECPSGTELVGAQPGDSQPHRVTPTIRRTIVRPARWFPVSRQAPAAYEPAAGPGQQGWTDHASRLWMP